MNDKAEDYTKIIMEDEYLMLYDDKIVISWLRDTEGKIVDFKTRRRLLWIDLISSLLGVIGFSWLIWYGGVKQGNIFIIVVLSGWCGSFFFRLLHLLYFSYGPEIQKDKIKKIFVDKKVLSILYDAGRRKKKRNIKLPKDKIDKETALQLLKSNKLID